MSNGHTFPRVSAGALVLANGIPLLGVLYGGWNAFDILVVFWLENAIIGFFNVLKMIWARDDATRDVFSWWSMFFQKLCMIPFFIVHYGGFTALHGFFLFEGLPSLFEGISLLLDRTWFAVSVAGLTLSHGISFFINYIGRREYRRAALGVLLYRPYARIVVMHLAICLGGFPVMAYDSPVGFVVLLVPLKIVADLFAHVSERKKFARTAVPR